jgi:hypothetical protein
VRVTSRNCCGRLIRDCCGSMTPPIEGLRAVLHSPVARDARRSAARAPCRGARR